MAETSKTADQALGVLLLVAERGPVNASDIARALSLNRTVAYRLLSTLQRRGFVRREDGGYVVGSIVLTLAEHVEPQIRTVAAPVMRRLAELVGETVVLHLPDYDHAVVVDQVVGNRHVVRVQHSIGSRHSLASGASGRALLAWSDRTTIARLVQSSDESDWLEKELEAVLAQGYAVSHDELQRGIHGIAAPIIARDGTLRASLALLAPVSRSEGVEPFTDRLADAAAEIGAQLAEKDPRSDVA